ncbi:MAG: hypothetical protein ABJC10_02910 [Acidobacteriota bacterium]
MPAGIPSAAARAPLRLWQAAHPLAGLPAPVMCCAWSNFALKLSLNFVGKLFKGGLPLLTSEWQMKHIGTFAVTNCPAWQLMQALCPGKLGVAELSFRW